MHSNALIGDNRNTLRGYPSGWFSRFDNDSAGVAAGVQYSNPHGKKSPDHVHVRPSVTGQRMRNETAAARQGHGQEQLVGQVFSDGDVRGKIAARLLHGLFGDRFGAHALGAKAGEDFRHLLAVQFQTEQIAGAE